MQKAIVSEMLQEKSIVLCAESFGPKVQFKSTNEYNK